MVDKMGMIIFDGIALVVGWVSFILIVSQHAPWHVALVLGTTLTVVAVAGAIGTLGLVAVHDRYAAGRRENPFDTDDA
jgi:hypothetical protein